jgi:hypothetical protein
MLRGKKEVLVEPHNISSRIGSSGNGQLLLDFSRGRPRIRFILAFAVPSNTLLRNMASSRMLRRVALVRTDVSEELSASIIIMEALS